MLGADSFLVDQYSWRTTAIAHFERRLISERTKDGINAARLKGKIPGRPTLDKEKLSSALKLIESGLSPTAAAKQLNIGRSTIYRELKYARQVIFLSNPLYLTVFYCYYFAELLFDNLLNSTLKNDTSNQSTKYVHKI